ncbi:uncharacterized protein LOC118411530 [Branchiostoma floridae]|uniref:Uncharacterized protein LOC118411530 n=1 Tax=Branchiostoma floridae TaxID=7739 RepID=A0A9J7MJT6_BRAFL|nr:uncharacterized protein LOC118411530 [Branchiostoma floridae]
MSSNCPLSCDLCPAAKSTTTQSLPPSSTATPAGSDCSDSSEHCPYWASIGECENNAGFMSSNCPLSCDACPQAKSTTTQPLPLSSTAAPAGSDCSDLSEHCPYWASIGECESNARWMSSNCPLSCDACPQAKSTTTQSLPLSSTATPAGSDCSDLSEHCPYWASIGECDSNTRWMESNCPLSCDACPPAKASTTQASNLSTTPAGPPGLRIAAMLRPTRLVDEGEQVTLLCLSDGSPSPRFTWTRGNGVALPPAAVVDPATGTLVIGRVRPEDDGEYTCTAEDGVDVVSSSVSFDACPNITDCSDTNRYCPSWAQNGECENNPGWMNSNCPLSCGVCHPDLPADCLTTKRGRAWDTWECTNVTSVPEEVRTKLQLDTFYQKYLHAYGIPILGSSILPDDALRRCCYDVLFMLADRRDLRDSYFNVYGRAAIMAESEVTLDIPEHSHMDESFNTRARGLGGTVSYPVSTGAEENVLCYQSDSLRVEDIFMHEFAHGVHNMAAKIVIPDFDDRLGAAYQDALANGRFANTYADDTVFEYWAEGVQSYFNVNHESDPPDGIHNYVNTREELRDYDPALYNLVQEIFPCGNHVVDRCVKDYDASEIKVDCKNGLVRTTIDGSTIFG